MAERPYQDPYAGRRLPDVPGGLPAMLRGFLGREEPGSVMEPGALEARSANNIGQGVSVLSDLTGLLPAKAMAAMGAIAPIIVGGKAKLGNDTLKAVVEANAMRKLLRSPTDIYKHTGLIANPQLPPSTSLPQWTQNLSINRPGETVLELLRKFKQPGKLRELIPDSPLMQRHGDVLGDIEYTPARFTGADADYGGDWNELTNTIRMNSELPTPAHEIGILNHELNHAVMTKLKQQYNGGSGWGLTSPLTDLQSGIGHGMADLFDMSGGPLNTWIAKQTRAASSTPDPYYKSSGEWLARKSEELGVSDMYGTPVNELGTARYSISDGVSDALYPLLTGHSGPAFSSLKPAQFESLLDDYVKALRRQHLPVPLDTLTR